MISASPRSDCDEKFEERAGFPATTQPGRPSSSLSAGRTRKDRGPTLEFLVLGCFTDDGKLIYAGRSGVADRISHTTSKSAVPHCCSFDFPPSRNVSFASGDLAVC